MFRCIYRYILIYIYRFVRQENSDHWVFCLPCIFGCNALSSCSLASTSTTPPNSSMKDDTVHYYSQKIAHARLQVIQAGCL